LSETISTCWPTVGGICVLIPPAATSFHGTQGERYGPFSPSDIFTRARPFAVSTSLTVPVRFWLRARRSSSATLRSSSTMRVRKLFIATDLCDDLKVRLGCLARLHGDIRKRPRLVQRQAEPAALRVAFKDAIGGAYEIA